MKESSLLSEKIYYDLLNEILYGRYYPGMHLVEAELMNTFSVSRPTIREVFKRLIEDELLEQIPHKGVRVRSLSEKEVHDYYQINKALEGIVAHTVALQRNDSQLQELEQILAKDYIAVKNGNLIEHQQIIHSFHSTLALDAGNEPLAKLIVKIYRILSLHTTRRYGNRSMELAYKNHTDFLEAIRLQDPIAAETKMKALIQASMAFF